MYGKVGLDWSSFSLQRYKPKLECSKSYRISRGFLVPDIYLNTPSKVGKLMAQHPQKPKTLKP